MNEQRAKYALTDSQKTRIEFARRDLRHARTEDLARLDAAGLILAVERLRRRLDDMLDLIAELSDGTPPTDNHP